MPALETENAVLVIGGGAAGLSTAGALARRGVASTVLDRDDHIGGSWSRRYQCLKLHTTRRFSGLAHYPIPTGRPRYLSKDEYAAYLKEYAQVLGLNVSLGERVDTVRRLPESTEGLNWEVTTNRGTRRAPVVVIATGHYAEARLPAWLGIEDFTGTLLHSSHYGTGADYKGLRSLVVGLGNSGAEIAADLATQGAASVAVSVRTMPPIVTREMFGFVPVQLLGIALTPLGIPRLIDRIGTAMRRRAIGDLTRFGLGEAQWGPFSARKPAVIDAGFIAQLKQGNIAVRPAVERIDGTAVVYADGSRETVDVVIAATGYRTGLEQFLKLPDVIDADGQPFFRSGRSTPLPGLYFVGFDETLRGHLFEIERESRRLALDVTRFLEQARL